MLVADDYLSSSTCFFADICKSFSCLVVHVEHQCMLGLTHLGERVDGGTAAIQVNFRNGALHF